MPLESSLPPVDFDLELALSHAIALAWAAADVAMNLYRPGIAVDIKNNDPGNMVTQADKDANQLIVAGLQRQFADDGILAEETSDSHAYAHRKHKRRLWCVDPIDGTREFVARTGDFAVMIGLAIDGAARLGVVLQPTQGRVYAGLLDGEGRGRAFVAQRDGSQQPLRVNDVTARHALRQMVSRSFRSRGITALAENLGIHTLLPMGSVGLKMAMLAGGHAELYASLGSQTHEWDACGPEAILRAAGGMVTDLDGKALRYNKPTTPTPRGIMASNGAGNGSLHKDALAAVQRLEQMRKKS